MTDLPPLPRILPDGIDDRLPPVAFARQKVMSDLLQFFYGEGYDFIDPPLVEYLVEDADGGGGLSGNFIGFDPSSGRPLVIRSDMTSGVARIASDKLSAQPRPLKLCYGGDILRPVAINGKRQLTQVGIEIIGGNADQHTAMLQTLFAALDGIITRPLWCDLALPSVARTILNQLPAKQKLLAENYVRHKDHSALKAMQTAPTDFLIDLMGLSGLAADVVPLLQKYENDKTIGTVVKDFTNLLSALAPKLEKLQQPPHLAIDITELLGFDYKTGFAFTLFDRDNKTTIGRGGQYLAGKEQAVGFSLYLDNLLPMVKPAILTEKRKG